MARYNGFETFIQTIESPNTMKVVKSMASLGEHDYSNVTLIDLEQIILSIKPKSPKEIITICYVLGLYAKHIDNEDMKYMLNDIDKDSLWVRAKPNASKKFISFQSFMNVYNEIGKYEEHNCLYQQTLFRSIYEGIYCDDMSVLKNIRSSDVENGLISLRDDNGNQFKLKISDKLSADLCKLGEVDAWQRNNRFGVCNIPIQGHHKDTCFKVESRNGSSENTGRYTYYRILRKISKEYLGYNLLPLQLYVSGIMHRIKIELEEHDMDMEYAFLKNNKDRIVSKIISDELKRSNCDTEVRNFREMVRGHIDVFS